MNRRELFLGSIVSALGAVAAKLGIKTPRSFDITFSDWSKPAEDVDVITNTPETARTQLWIGHDDGTYHEVEGITSIDFNKEV